MPDILDFLKDYTRRIEMRNRATRQAWADRAQRGIELLTQDLPLLVNEDCPVLMRHGARVTLFPLGKGRRTSIANKIGNGCEYLYCDSYLYLGTDSHVYRYGLPDDARAYNSQLRFQRIKLNDAPLGMLIDIGDYTLSVYV